MRAANGCARVPARSTGVKSSLVSGSGRPQGAGMTTETSPADSDQWYRNRYHGRMAMNLRLPEALAEALRALAEETGRSQQELAREALEEYVRDYRLRAYPKEIRHLITPARYRPDDPRAMEAIRKAWVGIDARVLLDDLLRERAEDWR